LSIQSSRRAKVRDPTGRGDACTGEDDDLLGSLEELDGLLDGIEVWKLLAATEDAGEDNFGEGEKVDVGCGWVTQTIGLVGSVRRRMKEAVTYRDNAGTKQELA